MFLNKREFVSLLSLFVIWKTWLYLLSVAAILLLPQYSKDFFGGGFDNYQKHLILYPWANFDGEHFVSIAQSGYKSLEYAFFPLYPKIISVALPYFKEQLFAAILLGQITSSLFFLGAMIVFYKLLRLDYFFIESLGVIILLLVFPTSFFFSAVYSESLFLLLTLLSFYFGRKKNWLLAAVFGGAATLSRFWGVLIFPALLIEAWVLREQLKRVFWLLLIPISLLGYMIYLQINFGDYLAFYHQQLVVGEQHQSGVVLLPQVFYRYLKILFSLEKNSYKYFNLLLEFLLGILFLFLPIYGYFKKIRLSYLFFALSGYLLPTIQGSFSSMPRYILVLFPSFIALYYLIEKIPLLFKLLLILVLLVVLGGETMLFLRGYWVA